MAKQILTGLDLLSLPSLTTPKTGSVGFGAKSDGLYQKIGAVESKLSIDGHTHTISDVTGLQTALNSKLETSIFNTHNTDNVRHITGAERTKWDKVVTDFNNLEIGGRNLLLDSEKERRANNTILNIPFDYTRMVGEGLFTISLEAKINSGDSGGFDFYFRSNAAIGEIPPTKEANQDWERFSHTWELTRTQIETILTVSVRTTLYQSDILIRNIKVEKGNKATDWTPAPEDQVSDWATTDVNSFSFIKNKPTLLSQFTDNIGVATHIANTSNPHSVTKAQVGLGNVDNTSDTNKPISTATQTALNLKANLASPTFTGTVTAPTFSGALSGNATTATTATKLGTATVGSTQLPFYLNAGTATAITQANLRIGLFGTTAIGSATKPIYINTNGVPTASTSFGGVTGIGTANPLMDGTVAVGTSSLAARQDHRHPVDTSRAAVGQTMYIGTTAVAINRASATLNLTGIGALTMGGALTGATTISASTSVTTPKVIFAAAGWSMEQVGNELQMKHNNVLKMRFTSTGSIVATEEITAFG